MSPDTWILSDYKLHAHVSFRRHPFVYGFCVDLIGLILTLCMQPKCCPREVICIGVVRCSTRKILQEKTLSLSCCICFTKYNEGHICIFYHFATMTRCRYLKSFLTEDSHTHLQYIPRNVHTVLLCFALLWLCNRSKMNSHEVFIHIHQGCFAGTGAIVRLPQCQWSKPDGYGKISQCITTTKHSKAVTVCIFLGIYCTFEIMQAIP